MSLYEELSDIKSMQEQVIIPRFFGGFFSVECFNVKPTGMEAVSAN